jgi:hypothetical protein
VLYITNRDDETHKCTITNVAILKLRFKTMFQKLSIFCLYQVVIIKVSVVAGDQWLTPIILATSEAEIKRIMVQASLGICENPSPK